MPVIEKLLFDFPGPHKVDLEKFMLIKLQFLYPSRKVRPTARQESCRVQAGFSKDIQRASQALVAEKDAVGGKVPDRGNV